MKKVQHMFTASYLIGIGFPVFLFLGALEGSFSYFTISLICGVAGIALFFIALYKRNKLEREMRDVYKLITEIGI